MAAQKGGKKVTAVRKRRERKNIDRGQAHIQSTFKQYDCDHHRYAGQRC